MLAYNEYTEVIKKLKMDDLKLKKLTHLLSVEFKM